MVRHVDYLNGKCLVYLSLTKDVEKRQHYCHAPISIIPHLPASQIVGGICSGESPPKLYAKLFQIVWFGASFSLVTPLLVP